MELRPEFLLPTIAKTLQDVVLPVLDEDQQVAQEQLKLAIGFLNIMARQAPLQFSFDVDELHRLLDLAKSLDEAVGGNDASRSAIAAAEAASGDSHCDPASTVILARRLRVAVTELIERGHARADKALDGQISALVNAFSKIQLERERAWVLPMGFENRQDAVPSIAIQLGLPERDIRP